MTLPVGPRCRSASPLICRPAMPTMPCHASPRGVYQKGRRPRSSELSHVPRNGHVHPGPGVGRHVPEPAAGRHVPVSGPAGRPARRPTPARAAHEAARTDHGWGRGAETKRRSRAENNPQRSRGASNFAIRELNGNNPLQVYKPLRSRARPSRPSTAKTLT